MTSKIGWLWPPWVDSGETLNYILGCTHAGGPGCDHCWAESDTWIRQHNTNPKVAKANEGLTVMRANGRPRWTNRINRLPERLAKAFRTRKRWAIFAPSKSDPWHPELMADEDGRRLIAAFYGAVAATPGHTWIALTKRPDAGAEHQEWIREQARIRATTPARFCMDALASIFDGLGENALAERVDAAPTPAWPVPNLWALTSVEDQQRYDERIGGLLRMEAAVLGLSAEPLLGEIVMNDDDARQLSWIIAGGEAGPGSRPMHPDWVRRLRDQATAAGTPFQFKQWGDHAPWITEEWFTRGGAEKRAHTWVAPDGSVGECWIVDDDGSWSNWTGDPPSRRDDPHTVDVEVMSRIGKGKSGRILDGRTWDEYPHEPEVTRVPG